MITIQIPDPTELRAKAIELGELRKQAYISKVEAIKAIRETFGPIAAQGQFMHNSPLRGWKVAEHAGETLWLSGDDWFVSWGQVQPGRTKDADLAAYPIEKILDGIEAAARESAIKIPDQIERARREYAIAKATVEALAKDKTCFR